MTPIFFNSSSNNYSSYPTDHYEDHLHTHQFLTPISQPSSSSKSLTTHMFLNSSDQNGIFNEDLNESPQYQHEGNHFGSQAYKDHGIENNNMKGLVDLSTWNKSSDLHQVKWMSSKMRVMLKMKKSDHQPMNINTYSSTSTQVTKLEEHNSPMEETDNSSNSTSSNNNIPIRVCSDCNTTKTPLWRSGPRGPKSLCNACGIRQRKARRAAAAAAAAENGDGCVYNNQLVIAPLKVTKTQHKDHKKPSKGHVAKYKKRQYSKQITTTTTTTTPPPSASPSSSLSPSPLPSPSPPSSSPPARKNGVEEFLMNLSKNLTFYHVLPQDEREAAILLMAISCGYAHET
ncbi:putative transcription factor C2C2-GATA family [Helianthus annuus]|uniref:Putative zinc finger, NHR/GATA-type n=1 Tax=Helianthus annuus TaxID=4232 RepID=A0A251SYU7_HELAN|nr:GATA transcription factor 21 [Helianthus annuus]KAF5776218.1 putative transcription factor C2C2-GATA family [Helianthus annuus]KAJ0491282.1 putative transcription factor C2C2-GATA family [Helianthus annuus]KAJ0503770.1 putative transcription factor C2C2-GATA family [Helianthus annuus]